MIEASGTIARSGMECSSRPASRLVPLRHEANNFAADLFFRDGLNEIGGHHGGG